MNEEIKPENVRIHSRADELIACLEVEIAKRDARIMGLESQYQRDVWGLNNEGDPIGGEPAGGYANDNARLRSELAAIKAKSVMPDVNLAAKALCSRHAAICGVDEDDQWKEYGQDFIADAETVLANSRLYAAPVQQVSVPDGATLILGDTGRKDLDRLIDRLMSSDPDFEDCTAAAALLRRLFMEEISGPKGHATWKDAAVAERLRRVSMRPSETVVAMAREGLAVYSGPNMNEHKVCAEIVRLADISDTAMLAAPAAPAQV